MYTELRKVLSQQNIFFVKIPINLKLDNWIGKKIELSFDKVDPNLSLTRDGPLGVYKKPCVEAYLKLNCENPSNEDPLKGSFKV